MIPLRDSAERRGIPFFAWSLVIGNVVVFVHQHFLLDARGEQSAFVASFAAVPAEITAALTGQGPFVEGLLPVVTSMFLHAGFLHLIGNMWFLWIFGDNVEGALGHFRFLLFYLGTGVFATTVHFLTEPGSQIPLVGASGAIAGVMGAYLVQFPTSRVTVLLPLVIIWTTVQLPAFVMLLYWLTIQVVNGMAGASGGGGVAWWAHVGGFVAGAALGRLLDRRQRRGGLAARARWRRY